MATISNTPRPGYVWDSADNVWYPIGVGAHQHTNAADTPAVMPYSTYAAAGKNKFLNADMSINQYALTSIVNPNTVIIDRFRGRYDGADGTSTYSYQTFTSGEAPIQSYEQKNYLRVVTAGQTTTSTRTNFEQFIEDVRTFAGQTITFSFYAKSGSGTPSIALELGQNFGTGGSSAVVTAMGTKTLSTNWQRFTSTITVPSVSGTTIGANNFIWLAIIVSAGSAFTRGQGIGIQSNTFDTWGWQVEAGSTVTAFQTATGNPASELAACQRYYYRQTSGSAYGWMAYGGCQNTTNGQVNLVLPVQMRVVPTALEYANVRCTDSTYAGTLTSLALATSESTPNSADIYVVATGLTGGRPLYVGANNNAAAYVAVTAEL